MPIENTVLCGEILKEMDRQNQKWGQYQNLPFIHVEAESYEKIAQLYKERNDATEGGAGQGWDSVLLEEVYEAFSAHSPEDIHTELIQVAAVALRIIKNLEHGRA